MKILVKVKANSKTEKIQKVKSLTLISKTDKNNLEIFDKGESWES